MIRKLIKFFGIIIIGVLILTLYLRYNTDYFQIQEKINGIYLNERFGYEITCEEPWYVWPYYSREMAVAGQTRDSSVEELGKCVKDKKCGAKLESQLQGFKQKWTVGNSDIIFLTDSSLGDLNQFFDWNNRIKVTDLPVGHWIKVFPTSLDPDLKKERLEGRIKIKTIALKNGLDVQQIDSRTLDGTLSILVPHNFDSKLDSEEQAKSLNFITDAESGSDSEKAFYEIVNSLSFH